MFTRTWRGAVLGFILASGAAGSAARGDNNASKTMYLSFSRPVRLPGVALASGTYIFELADPFGASDVVRVSSHDRKIVYLQTYTRTITGSGSHASAPVVFAEGPVDQPLKLLIWWPPEDPVGREFIYKSDR